MSTTIHDGNITPYNLTMVAVDKDKNSGHAFRWATNNIDNPIIIAVHVKQKNNSHQGMNIYPPDEEDVANVFNPLRQMCHQKVFKMKEAVIAENDVIKALLDYAQRNYIQTIVIGASSTSTKNPLTRSLNMRTRSKKFKSPDVGAAIMKSAPDYSSVYVISKGKVVGSRPAIRTMVNLVAPPKQQFGLSHSHSESENGVRGKRSNNGRSLERSPIHERTRSSFAFPSLESVDLSNNNFGQRSQFISRNASTGESRSSRSSYKFGSMNSSKQNCDFSFPPDPPPSGDLEAEMKMLRFQLKQTMDMYSSACKEAIAAQTKANEINQWKLEEARKVEEVKLLKEAAIAMAEKEKERAKAALEAAEEAMKMAQMKAKRRLHAEMKAKREEEEKQRALSHQFSAYKDIMYRKYTIDDIENGTQNFSLSMRIGEGGYGPVFKGLLDHTHAAIKLLNPEASQGRKQFQQEVEVLSTIRHPNMVLLLGACPEYGCLVYEYMDNGSLEDRLLRKQNSPAIPWRKRFEIAAEIATALLFLHQAKPEPIVHRDLKPANILLDRNLVSKISDVGLARLVPPSVANSVTQYHLTAAAGTFCYIDPEYQQSGMLTTKSDIYSLGITLLQIITAKPPMGLAHHVRRAIENGNFEEILDPVVTDWPIEETLEFAKLSLKCAELCKKDRPDLASVIVPELNRLRDFGYGILQNNNNNVKNYYKDVPNIPLPKRSPRIET